jgi:polyphosphate kinase 2
MAAATAKRRQYFRELLRLQGELVKLQDWVAHTGYRMIILFEGRDAAGKGGVIKRITQRLNPRVVRTVALPAPSDREKTQWYFQRYVPHFPAAGEIVLFDRSWYNRAGVERVMVFCSDDDYKEFFRSTPEFERMLVRSGIKLVKYWFSINDDEQHIRFLSRINDPLKQWKLSPMDLQSAIFHLCFTKHSHFTWLHRSCKCFFRGLFNIFLRVELQTIAYCNHETARSEIRAASLVACFAWRLLKSGLNAQETLH